MRRIIVVIMCAALALAGTALGEGGTSDARGVYIRAVMASNKDSRLDEDGDSSDWIELRNGGDAAADLEGWAISDGKGYAGAWRLPTTTLAAGESMILFASGKDRPDAPIPHTDFKLSAKGETVLLFDGQGETVSSFTFANAATDVAVVRQADGSYAEEPWTAAESAPAKAAENVYDLHINEVYASGKGDDWVELICLGADGADLSGMGLTDDPDKPLRWRFPDGTRLESGELLVVALVGKDGQPPEDGGLYADFALSGGETLALNDAEGAVLDQVAVGENLGNISFGPIEGTGELWYFDTPTRGAPNISKAYIETRLDPVTFTRRRSGNAVAVALHAPEGAAIHYTTDGTQPDENSPLYKGELMLGKNTRIRAYCVRTGAMDSAVSSYTVLPGEDSGLRVVCVYGNDSTLRSGKKNSGTAVWAEAYAPDGTQLFAQECLMKLSGHSSRLELDQKAFSLRAQNAFDQGWFNARLFSKRDYDRCKSFVMRSSGQDCNQTHMLDSILTSLADATGVFYQETEVCVCYVNDAYWGLYNMRERVSPQSLAQFHGWADWDRINIVEDSGGSAYAAEGSAEGYHELLRWVRSHDLSDEANVAQLRELMDIENYLDYVALEMFSNNQDLDNTRCYNNPGTDARWRWVLFDLDLAFDTSFHSSVRPWLTQSRVGSITGQDNTLFPRLMANRQLRDRFLTRMGELLNGAFSAETVIAKIDARMDLIREEMKRNCQRWHWSYDTWEAACQRFRETAQARPATVARELRQAFSLTDEEVFRYFGQGG